MITNFNTKQFNKCLKEYQDNWKLWDDVLYDLCKKYPGHKNKNEVIAKLALIARSYNTGIERQIPSKENDKSSLEMLIDKVCENRCSFDSSINKLTNINEPLDIKKLKEILNVHGELVKILQEITRESHQHGNSKLSPKSFVSKYLHFHCPAVPVFDNIVYSHIPSLIRKNENSFILEYNEEWDKDYYDYVMRFWKLYNTEIKSMACKYAVKALDWYLLSLANEKTKQKGNQ